MCRSASCHRTCHVGWAVPSPPALEPCEHRGTPELLLGKTLLLCEPNPQSMTVCPNVTENKQATPLRVYTFITRYKMHTETLSDPGFAMRVYKAGTSPGVRGRVS